MIVAGVLVSSNEFKENKRQSYRTYVRSLR